MRGIDYNMAVSLNSHWQGKATPNVVLCPLLSDLDGLITYLDEIKFKPGHSVDPCPECGEEHRGALMSAIMLNATMLRPNSTSPLLGYYAKKIEATSALYGGKEGYNKYCEEADKFFATLNAKDVYRA